MTNITISPFLRGYIEAALFSTNDESTPDGGLPLDDNYSVSDIDSKTLAFMAHECAAFECQVGDVLARAECDRGDGTYSEAEQAGHDFWFTRNRSGVGFNDGDWSPATAAQYLYRVAQAYGEVYLYVGDDGVIYQVGAE